MTVLFRFATVIASRILRSNLTRLCFSKLPELWLSCYYNKATLQAEIIIFYWKPLLSVFYAYPLFSALNVSFGPKGIFWEKFQKSIHLFLTCPSMGEIKGLYTLRHFSDAFWRSWLDLYFKNADKPRKACGMTNPRFFLPGQGVINELSSYLKLAGCINTLRTAAAGSSRSPPGYFWNLYPVEGTEG